MNEPSTIFFTRSSSLSTPDRCIKAKKHSKKFLKQHISYQLDTSFRLVHELSYLVEKIFWSIFYIRGDPYPKKSKKKILADAWQFIHHLKALVEFRRFQLLLKSFRVFLVEKYSKNSEKTWIFDFFYKIVKKCKNSIFIPQTLMLSSEKNFFAR